MVHEHLTVAVAAGADTDRGDADRVGDHPGHAVGHALQHDREATGLGQRHRIVDDAPCRVELLALHLEAADRVDRLRREAQMAHHRDLGVEDGRDRVEPLAAALELHRAGAGADQRRRVADRLLARHVVAHPRQVAHDERPRLRARHRTDVVRHVLGGDLQRVVVAEHDHRERVAHEDHVDAGTVDDPRARRVVRGDHDEGFAALGRDDVRRGDGTRPAGPSSHLVTSAVQGTHGSRQHRKCRPRRGRPRQRPTPCQHTPRSGGRPPVHRRRRGAR